MWRGAYTNWKIQNRTAFLCARRLFCTRLMKYQHFRHHELQAYFFYSYFQWNTNILAQWECAPVCWHVLGYGRHFFVTRLREYQHFRFWRFLSFTKVSIFPRKYQHFLYFELKLYKSINISKEISIVLRYVDLMTLFGGVEGQVPFLARGVFVTRPMVFQWFWHMSSTPKRVAVKNHCFYTGFISKMKSLAYFCLASWVGLKAPFVTPVLRHALKPQRGSKYYGETSLFAL